MFISKGFFPDCSDNVITLARMSRLQRLAGSLIMLLLISFPIKLSNLFVTKRKTMTIKKDKIIFLTLPIFLDLDIYLIKNRGENISQ